MHVKGVLYMKKVWSILTILACCILCGHGLAEGFVGIYASIDHPDLGTVVIHEDGRLEEYGDASDLPENTVSFGYATLVTRYQSEEKRLVTDEGLVFSWSPVTSWKDATYTRVDECAFFPTSAQLASLNLKWQNDQLGDLTFDQNGTVYSDEKGNGTYDNGILKLAGREFLVQRSVWSDGLSGEYLLSDQTLVLYQMEDCESVDRLLLVADEDE